VFQGLQNLAQTLHRPCTLQDDTWHDVLSFLAEAERRGEGMDAAYAGPGSSGAAGRGGGEAGEPLTVRREAQLLRRLFEDLRR
jgi:hypothetical protein